MGKYNTLVKNYHGLCLINNETIIWRIGLVAENWCSGRFASFLPPASEGWGRYYFHRCLSIHTCGGYPSPRIFQSLVPGPFQGGGTPVLAKGRGYFLPQLGQDRDTPQPGQDWGTPLGRTGLGHLPPARTWLGYLPSQDITGYPLGQDRTEVPPPPPRQNSRANTCYAAGGMPLAFTQEDFLFK